MTTVLLPTAPAPTSNSQVCCHMLVPCAGVGQRALQAGQTLAKQYQALEGKPLVAHTLNALNAVTVCQASGGVWQQGQRVAVLSPTDALWATAVAPLVDGWLAAPIGGVSRADSVLNGLQHLLDVCGAQPQDWVLVHDAARCLLDPDAVHALIAACVAHKRGGLLAQPVPDTIKVARQHDVSPGLAAVADTVSRAGKWLAQTPQLFQVGSLRAALADAKDDAQAWPQITDEASAMERLGQSPLLVASGVDNFKVTYPTDFELARVILRGRNA